MRKNKLEHRSQVQLVAKCGWSRRARLRPLRKALVC